MDGSMVDGCTARFEKNNDRCSFTSLGAMPGMPLGLSGARLGSALIAV